MQEFRPLLPTPSVPWPREVISSQHLLWVIDDQLPLGAPFSAHSGHAYAQTGCQDSPSLTSKVCLPDFQVWGWALGLWLLMREG